MNTILSILVAVSLTIIGQPMSIQDTAAESAVSARAVSYQLVTAPYPSSVQQVWKQIRLSGGHEIVSDEKATYVIIGLGKRSTGGYRVAIDQVTQLADGSYLVKVHEQKPVPGLMTTQVISYPTAVIALPKTSSAITVTKS